MKIKVVRIPDYAKPVRLANGCTVNAQGHLRECTWMAVGCPKMCGAIVRKKELSDHIESGCMRTLTVCEFCHMQVSHFTFTVLGLEGKLFFQHFSLNSNGR